MAAGKSWELSQTKIAAIALLVLIVVMFLSSTTFKPYLEKPVFLNKEGRLAKNTILQITPGESYTYAYSMVNESMNLTYVVLAGGNCTIIAVLGGQGSPSVCIDAAGNDKTGQNSTYAVPAVILTKPWMLAVSEGWQWNVSSYLTFDSIVNHLGDTNYTVVRKEYYKGREAYVVKLASSEEGSADIWDWVDSEKRVLLREVSSGYEVELVSGLQFDQ